MNGPAAPAKPGERRDLTCPEAGCNGHLVLRASRFGPFYGCTRYPACRAAHGAHPDGRPLGIPADKATKDARIRAHAAFDPLWRVDGLRGRDKRRARGRAYRWLARQLGYDEAYQLHIGEASIDQCARVVEACEGVTREEVQRRP